MKDAGFALRKAYHVLLSGLTYSDKSVAVYDLMAPSGVDAPYVILGPWTANRDNTKSSLGQTGEINLDVFTRFTGNARSTRPAAEIAELITDLLKPEPTSEVLEVEGFASWNTIVVNTADIAQPTGTDIVIRKIITVSHTLCQQ